MLINIILHVGMKTKSNLFNISSFNNVTKVLGQTIEITFYRQIFFFPGAEEQLHGILDNIFKPHISVYLFKIKSLLLIIYL